MSKRVLHETDKTLVDMVPSGSGVMLRFWNKEAKMRGQPHILMYGNPSDGFRFVGPFDGGTEAIEYAEANPEHRAAGRDWWVIPLDAPAGKRR